MDAKIEFITSVNQELWDAYAHHSLDTWQHEPTIYWEPEDTHRIWNTFRSHYADLKPEPDFAHTWQRFSHKVEHQINHLEHSHADYVVWLDADVTQIMPISEEALLSLMPTEEYVCSYLGRGNTYHPETGWIAWNCKHPELRGFLQAWRECYLQGYVFHFDQWHDAYVWDKLMRIRDIPRQNLCEAPHKPGEAFGRSALKEYYMHHKGPRKKSIK